jgi:hypothetical protein
MNTTQMESMLDRALTQARIENCNGRQVLRQARINVFRVLPKWPWYKARQTEIVHAEGGYPAMIYDMATLIIAHLRDLPLNEAAWTAAMEVRTSLRRQWDPATVPRCEPLGQDALDVPEPEPAPTLNSNLLKSAPDHVVPLLIEISNGHSPRAAAIRLNYTRPRRAYEQLANLRQRWESEHASTSR